jgi:hypothetical protein
VTSGFIEKPPPSLREEPLQAGLSQPKGGLRGHTRPMIRACSPPAIPAGSATAGGAGSTPQHTCERRALAPFCTLSRTRYVINPPPIAGSGGAPARAAPHEASQGRASRQENAAVAQKLLGPCHQRWRMLLAQGVLQEEVTERVTLRRTKGANPRWSRRRC